MMKSHQSNDKLLQVYLYNHDNSNHSVNKCINCNTQINNYINDTNRDKYCKKCWINKTYCLMMYYK